MPYVSHAQSAASRATTVNQRRPRYGQRPRYRHLVFCSWMARRANVCTNVKRRMHVCGFADVRLVAYGRPMSEATLTFLGAAQGVTGSCYHLRLGDAALLIDCGTFQGDRDADARNRAVPELPLSEVLACVYTHGHLDHVGRLPGWLQHGFRGEVWGHAATLDIAAEILRDSAKIANYSPRDRLYGTAEVAQVIDAMRAARGYGVPFAIGPFTLTLFDAGHILGSASVRVQWGQGSAQRAILFSGDLGVKGAPIIRDPFTAWDPARDWVDYVVTESTYGDRTHPPRNEVRASLREVVQRALDDGGKVLIPAFSIGRTQEIIYELSAMVRAGELRGIPIVIDGPLGMSATGIYAKHTDCYDQEALALLRQGDAPLELDSVDGAHHVSDSRRAVMERGPAIVVAGSGMCQGGRIRAHLKQHLPNARTDVLLVGYQAQRTLGRDLQQGDKTVFIDGDEVAVRARITTISGLSAHADRDGLAAWLAAVPVRHHAQVFVTHGEPAQAAAYAKLVTDRFGLTALAPAYLQTVAL